MKSDRPWHGRPQPLSRSAFGLEINGYLPAEFRSAIRSPDRHHARCRVRRRPSARHRISASAGSLACPQLLASSRLITAGGSPDSRCPGNQRLGRSPRQSSKPGLFIVIKVRGVRALAERCGPRPRMARRAFGRLAISSTRWRPGRRQN
jgi:hypothetical protein